MSRNNKLHNPDRILFGNNTFLQLAGEHCLRTTPSCKLHGNNVRKHNLPAGCRRSMFANTILPQAAGEQCMDTQARCKLQGDIASAQKLPASVRQLIVPLFNSKIDVVRCYAR